MRCLRILASDARGVPTKAVTVSGEWILASGPRGVPTKAITPQSLENGELTPCRNTPPADSAHSASAARREPHTGSKSRHRFRWAQSLASLRSPWPPLLRDLRPRSPRHLPRHRTRQTSKSLSSPLSPSSNLRESDFAREFFCLNRQNPDGLQNRSAHCSPRSTLQVGQKRDHEGLPHEQQRIL